MKIPCFLEFFYIYNKSPRYIIVDKNDNKNTRLNFIYLYGPVCLMESSFFWKVNSGKVNYFPMFGSVMKNKLENTFQCLVMS